MSGHLGFSYIGLVFLFLLFIPNMIWTGKKPQGYIPENENKLLLILERIGQGMFTVYTTPKNINTEQRNKKCPENKGGC